MLRKYKCLFSLVLEKYFSKVLLDIADVEEIENHLIAYYNQWDFSQEKDFVNRKKGHREETLLHYYASSQNELIGIMICHLLLTYGADINSTDREGKTPLHRAVAACKYFITKLLLSQCAHVNAKDTNNDTPLHNLCTVNSCDLFLSEGGDPNIKNLCDLLLSQGGDPNIKNSFNETPTFRAVKNVEIALPHCKEIVELLLNRGGSVVIKDLHRQNAIEVASGLDNKEIFNLCNQNVENSSGKR